MSVLDGLVAPMNGSEPVGEVSLLRPGSVTQAPSGPANAEVHGEPAWFVDDPSGRLAGGLYWEYAPDALAALHMRPPEIPMATFVAIAENVTFVDPYPARLPYRLDFMPADLRPISLGSGRNGGRYALVFANDLGDVESEDGHPREVHISILDNRPVPTDALRPGYTTLPWQPPTTIGAHRVRCAEAPGGLNFDERQMCELEIQGDILIIDAVELSPTELKQLIAGLTLADLAEPTTWFTSTEALP